MNKVDIKLIYLRLIWFLKIRILIVYIKINEDQFNLSTHLLQDMKYELNSFNKNVSFIL